jgi:hypothetical protein
MPLQATSGAASYDAFGGGVAAVPNYIEEVFQTWLYTGNGSARSITNGIDLAGKGGLVWCKPRSNADGHFLFDTARGVNNYICTNQTIAQNGLGSNSSLVNSFNSNGFDIGADTFGAVNVNGYTYASWTFREQPKFFDIVTYTGNDVTSRQISHSLGSVPGCIIVKCTSNSASWVVYHRSLSTDSGTVDSNNLILNSTGSESGGGCFGDDQYQTSSYFTLGRLGSGSNDNFNRSGRTYVAYLFAHNAGGFGLTGTDNVISCGSYTGTGAAGNFVSLGYEPQWLLIKRTNTTGNWLVLDTMRGIATGGVDAGLFPNLSNAEDSANDYLSVNATGFELTGASTTVNASGSTYIYIAIRRGPMKVPTDPTRVFRPNDYAANSGFAFTGTQSAPSVNPDLTIGTSNRASTRTNRFEVVDRLRGYGNSTTLGPGLMTNTTASEAANTIIFQNDSGGTSSGSSISAQTKLYYSFKRAPGFMDVCCYTGTGSASQTINHNLSVVPELVINKSRGGSARNWTVNYGSTTSLRLNLTNAAATDTSINLTSTTFDAVLGSGAGWNASGVTYVTYLFATCPGVSKVGSYTGNGTTQAIACGFTGGARFVLIKRTDSTGDWYVYDTARGMTVLTDPYLLLNSTAAETATLGSVITSTGGFTVNAAILAAINTNAASYIFFAVA